MRDEITIPVLKVEDFVAATMRRDKYSAIRDLQAMEFNTAITTRLMAEKKHLVKCDKCGKEFDAAVKNESTTCSECK